MITHKMLTSAILRDPVKILPHTPIAEAIALMEKSQTIKGDGPVLVVMNQRPERRPLGLLTPDCIVAQLAATPSLEQPLDPKHLVPIVCLQECYPQDIEQVQQLFSEHEVPYLLLLDEGQQICGLLSRQGLRSLLHPESVPYSDICDNLQPFFETSLNLLTIVDRQGRFYRVNPAWEKVLGYPRRTLIGQPILNFVHPEDHPATLTAMNQLNRGETIEGFVNRYRDRQGNYRQVEWYAQPYGEFIYANAQDITSRKHLEWELKKWQLHLQAAQRIAHLGSWEFDVATGDITWSEEVFRILGQDITLGPPDYNKLLQIYHPDDRPEHDRVVKRALQKGEAYDLECRVLHEDGHLSYIQARGEPGLDENGQVVSIMGTILDISDRKQQELHLLKTTAQLEASNRELEAFAYSVSHDLRAPLRAIDGFSQALVEDYGEHLDAEAQDYFERIRRNVSRMSQLIDDLLRLSRVSRVTIEPQTVNLSELAGAIARQLQEAYPGEPVKLQIAPELTLNGDPSLIEMMLTNLLENAWKFTHHQPQPQIEVGRQSSLQDILKNNPEFWQESSLDIAAETLNPSLLNAPVYFVRDNGVGFDMKYSKMLFGVFQRLHDTQEFPGTGIGLATVHRIVQRHGGLIWANGKVGQGATFYFIIP
jgi:PAS domain S-box-containing protein